MISKDAINNNHLHNIITIFQRNPFFQQGDLGSTSTEEHLKWSKKFCNSTSFQKDKTSFFLPLKILSGELTVATYPQKNNSKRKRELF